MDIEPVVSAIQRIKRMSDLGDLLREWRDESGLSHLVYHATSAPLYALSNPVLLTTYDPSWVKRYTEQDYFSLDPVVISGRRSSLPLDWMQVDHDSAAARHFFQEAESYGVGRHGFTFPIRGPHGERALFTFTSNDTDEQWHRRRLTKLATFHLAAHYLHDRAMQLGGFRPNPSGPSLTPRERQCVEGLVAGLTPQQIAAKLNVSPSAVHLYLRSAKRKLGCATIEHLVAKAVGLELIDPTGFTDS